MHDKNENSGPTACPSNDLHGCHRRNRGDTGYSRSRTQVAVRRYPHSSRCSITHLDFGGPECILQRTLARLGRRSGNLTPHGSTLMTLFGSYYRLYFADAGLLRPTGCGDASHIHILADGEARTRETGNALAAGLMPGCGIRTQTTSDGKDPLFSPLAAGIGKPDRALAAASISGRIGANPDSLIRVYRSAFDTLRELLFNCAPGVSCPAEEKPGKQSVLNQPSSLEASKGDHSADLRGPLRIGSTFVGGFPP